ncbi:MAG TPA: mechanosensitive ion channel family protein [Actinocrinis sp.]
MSPIISAASSSVSGLIGGLGDATGSGSSGTSGDSTSTSNTVAAQHVGNWFEQHTAALVGHGAQIVSVVVACLVIRVLARKSIRRVVHHATRVSEGRAARRLETEGSAVLAGERTRQRAQAIGSVLRSLATAIVFSVGGLIVLSLVDIPIAPVLASASVIGVAVGLGAKDLITDFIAGVFMIFEDQYGVGDVVDTGAAKGTVEEVGLRITKLRDVDGVIWYVRNGTIDRVGNKSQGWTRAVVDVPVEYGEDVGRVKEIMALTAEQFYEDEAWQGRFFGEAGRPQVVGIEALDADGVVIRMQARTIAQKNLDVERELRVRLKAALDEAGIKIASFKVS